MSPFEPNSQDPHHTETSTSPKGAMACSPLPGGGNDNEAADAAGGAATATVTEAAAVSSPAGGPSSQPEQQKQRPSQNPVQQAKMSTAAVVTTSSINATTTGLISPLTVMKNSNNNSSNNKNSGSSMSSRLKKHFPSSGNNNNKHNSSKRHMVEYTLPTTPQVDSYAISKIGQAREKIKRSFDKSKLLEHDEYVFPRFEMSELTLGEILGRGGFGTVLEIKEMEMIEDPEEEEDDEGGGGEMKSPMGFEDERSIFRIGDVDHDNNNNIRSKKKKSHSFRLRRPRDLSHDEDSRPASVRFSNSHDGCEGLAAYADRLSRISERTTIQTSRSHDCVDDCEGASSTPLTADGASTTPTSAEGGRKKHLRKRELRTKALSWYSPKAVAHDVSHFFHRSHKHLDASDKENEGGEEKKESGHHDELDRGLPKEDVLGKDPLKEVALGKGLPKEDMLDKDGTKLPRVASSDHGYMLNKDEIKLPRVAFSEHGVGGERRARRVSRNFSFRSWRDSEAGEEGNDAISREDLEKYNIDASFFCGSRNASRRNSMETTSLSIPVEEDDAEGTAGEIMGTSGALPGEPTPSGLQNELTVDTDVGTSRRRIVLFSTPIDGEQIEAQEEEATPSNVNASLGGHQDKPFMTQNATTSDGDARYVIKIISPKIVEEDFKKFLQAAMDMATETYFLSVLNHPHILKMRAVGQGDMFSPSYFLVLDRLYDTLSDRIEGPWKQQLDHLTNDFLVWNRAAKLKTLWNERMTVMKNLAGAIAHLHDMKIIYRDLKPENVGFDIKGNVKLFDFGLAKELHEEDECSNGTYKLTPNTGSIRYMAPENGNQWPYNFMADSYSFGIMLWEIIALERPFANYSPREIRDMVMKWGERPRMMNEDWSEGVVQLMKMAWDVNFRKRPTMRAIEDALEKEIEDSVI